MCVQWLLTSLFSCFWKFHCVYSLHMVLCYTRIFLCNYIPWIIFFTHTTSIISLLPLLYDILISRTVCIYIHVIYTVMILCIYIHFRAHDHKNHNYLSFGEDFNSPNVIIFSWLHILQMALLCSIRLKRKIHCGEREEGRRDREARRGAGKVCSGSHFKDLAIYL